MLCFLSMPQEDKSTRIKVMKYLDLSENKRFARVVLGCDHYGETIPSDVARAAMDSYLASGGNVFDTACCYGQQRPDTPSTSEVLVGKHLRDFDRSSYIIITKGGHPPRTDFHQSRITEKALKYDIMQSLDQLGTVPDWWLFHRDNPDIPAAELIDFANSYIDAGLMKNIGVSNWSVQRIEEANNWAAKHSKVQFSMSQMQFSLAACTLDSWGDDTIQVMDKTSLDWYRKTGMPYTCFSSQGRGIIQKIAEGRDLGKAYRFDLPANRKLAEKVKEIAKRDGVSLTAVCLAFITSQDSNSMAVVGASSVKQLEETLSCSDYSLGKEDIEELSEIRGMSI